MEDIEFLLYGFRIIFSFIGTFLVITFGFAVLARHIYKICYKHKWTDFNYALDDCFIYIGMILASCLIPFYYIP